MKIGARCCTIHEISQAEATSFLIQYHRQKAVFAIYNIGLFYNDILIGLMTFGSPRYNLKYQWELLRLCFKPDYHIIGGTQKLFNYFIKKYDPHSIVSYCDYNYFTGDIYDKLGFTKIRLSKGSKIWYKDNRFITDNLLRQYGADKLIGTNDGKGASNEKIMLREGWQYKIDEKGQGTYIWNGSGKFGYVYLITDTLNNKQYVGQHRGYKLDEKYYGTGKIIKHLINKHGIGILKREILDYASSQQELSEKEIEYIKKYDTLWPKGYNLTLRMQAIEPYTTNAEISVETRQKLSEYMKERWKDEEFRNKFSTLQKQLWQSQNYRQEQSESRKRAWEDTEYRSLQIKHLEQLRNNPKNKEKRLKSVQTQEYKQKRSNLQKELWKDENYRDKICKKRKVQATPEAKQKMSDAQKDRFENKEERLHLSNVIKALYEKTDMKKKVSEASKKNWQNEEYKEKISTARKKQWQDKAYREKRKEIMSQYWNDPIKKEKWLKKHKESMQSETHRKKVAKDMIGRKWWNNGITCVFQREKPEGNEWVAGRIKKK